MAVSDVSWGPGYNFDLHAMAQPFFRLSSLKTRISAELPNPHHKCLFCLVHTRSLSSTILLSVLKKWFINHNSVTGVQQVSLPCHNIPYGFQNTLISHPFTCPCSFQCTFWSSEKRSSAPYFLPSGDSTFLLPQCADPPMKNPYLTLSKIHTNIPLFNSFLL